jgi:hypothetical protein
MTRHGIEFRSSLMMEREYDREEMTHGIMNWLLAYSIYVCGVALVLNRSESHVEWGVPLVVSESHRLSEVAPKVPGQFRTR